MFSSSQERRESIIAIILVLLCLAALVTGLFLIKKNSELAEADQSKIVDSLRTDRIAVIGLEGVIFDSFQSRNPFKSYLNVAYVKDELNKAIEDTHVKGVLLRVNSPGGTVAASQEIYQLINKLEKKKPVVVSMSDVCASGCYYISSASDYIVANPGTLTGSIGVISSGLNIKGLLDRFGIVDQTFKAGKYKDMASTKRIVTAEEREIMQKLLDSSYKQFLDDVEKGRHIERAKLEEIAQGLVYTGAQALDVGLVDQLGTYEDAKLAIKKILKEKFKYSRTENIRFDETWHSAKFSTLDELLDLGMSGMMSRLGFSRILEGLGSANKTYPSALSSQYQLMWIMP